jgi:hypothetical protein
VSDTALPVPVAAPLIAPINARETLVTRMLLDAMQDGCDCTPVALFEHLQQGTDLTLREIREVMSTEGFMDAANRELRRAGVMSLLHCLPAMRKIAMGKSRRDATIAYGAIVRGVAMLKDGGKQGDIDDVVKLMELIRSMPERRHQKRIEITTP